MKTAVGQISSGMRYETTQGSRLVWVTPLAPGGIFLETIIQANNPTFFQHQAFSLNLSKSEIPSQNSMLGKNLSTIMSSGGREAEVNGSRAPSNATTGRRRARRGHNKQEPMEPSLRTSIHFGRTPTGRRIMHPGAAMVEYHSQIFVGESQMEDGTSRVTLTIVRDDGNGTESTSGASYSKTLEKVQEGIEEVKRRGGSVELYTICDPELTPERFESLKSAAVETSKAIRAGSHSPMMSTESERPLLILDKRRKSQREGRKGARKVPRLL